MIGFQDGERFVRFYAEIEKENLLTLSFNYTAEDDWAFVGTLSLSPYATCTRTHRLSQWLENHVMNLNPFRLQTVTQDFLLDIRYYEEEEEEED